MVILYVSPLYTVFFVTSSHSPVYLLTSVIILFLQFLPKRSFYCRLTTGFPLLLLHYTYRSSFTQSPSPCRSCSRDYEFTQTVRVPIRLSRRPDLFSTSLIWPPWPTLHYVLGLCVKGISDIFLKPKKKTYSVFRKPSKTCLLIVLY